MTTHARVLEQAVRGTGTVLPMRFGVVMAGEPAVKEHLLDAYHSELEQQLQEMKDKVELRLRAVYEEDALMREIVQEEPRHRAAPRRVAGRRGPGRHVLQAVELGELVAKAVERKRDQDAAAILDELAPMASESTTASLRTSGSCSTPVPGRSRPDAGVRRAVDAIGRAKRNQIGLKYVGPLPPPRSSGSTASAWE